MSRPDLVIQIQACVHWAEPPENSHEIHLRNQADIQVQAAACKLESAVKLILEQLLELEDCPHGFNTDN